MKDADGSHDDLQPGRQPLVKVVLTMTDDQLREFRDSTCNALGTTTSDAFITALRAVSIDEIRLLLIHHARELDAERPPAR